MQAVGAGMGPLRLLPRNEFYDLDLAPLDEGAALAAAVADTQQQADQELALADVMEALEWVLDMHGGVLGVVGCKGRE